MEIDPYDALRPVHLVQMSDDGSVIGCGRVLPTTGPTMLANTFPALLDGHEAPFPGLGAARRQRRGRL